MPARIDDRSVGGQSRDRVVRNRIPRGGEPGALVQRGDATARLSADAGELSAGVDPRSEEHTSELQSRLHLVCRLLLEKKKTTRTRRDAVVGRAKTTLIVG